MSSVSPHHQIQTWSQLKLCTWLGALESTKQRWASFSAIFNLVSARNFTKSVPKETSISLCRTRPNIHDTVMPAASVHRTLVGCCWQSKHDRPSQKANGQQSRCYVGWCWWKSASLSGWSQANSRCFSSTKLGCLPHLSSLSKFSRTSLTESCCLLATRPSAETPSKQAFRLRLDQLCNVEVLMECMEKLSSFNLAATWERGSSASSFRFKSCRSMVSRSWSSWYHGRPTWRLHSHSADIITIDSNASPADTGVHWDFGISSSTRRIPVHCHFKGIKEEDGAQEVAIGSPLVMMQRSQPWPDMMPQSQKLAHLTCLKTQSFPSPRFHFSQLFSCPLNGLWPS